MNFATMSVSAIKQYIEEITDEDGQSVVEQLTSDSRKSVVNLGLSLQRRLDKFQAEKQRIFEMGKYERKAILNGYQYIAGVDEVGRGPLAGPVVAAAVILPFDADLPGINDSKKLTERQREQLYEMICQQAIAYHIVEIDHKKIDEINILQASRLAMKEALAGLPVQPDFVLVDGLDNPMIDIDNEAIVKGDSKSISIAAASIIAKVYRDRLMDELDGVYPGYGFAKHKGYPAPMHLQAIEELGPCPIHRMTFKPLNNDKKI